MEKWQEFIWQLMISVFVIFFGGWILGGVLNLVAMASPQMVSIIFCPAGSTAIYGSAIDQPNRDRSVISCQDQNGASTQTLSYAERVVLQRKYFSTPGNIIMFILVVGWFIWQKKKRKQANL